MVVDDSHSLFSSVDLKRLFHFQRLVRGKVALQVHVAQMTEMVPKGVICTVTVLEELALDL